MKKSLLVVCAVAILALGAVPAFGQGIDLADQITLASSPVNSIKFTGDGAGGFTLNFINVTGNASGQGILIGANNSKYSITQNGDVVTSLGAGSGCGGFCIALNDTGTMLFTDKIGATTLLTGDLTLVDISQVVISGTTNNEVIVNLSNLGGTLASQFHGMGGIVQLRLLLDNPGGIVPDLTNLNLNQKAFARVHDGAVNPALPEPTSLALLGSGLAGFAGMIRRRKKLSVL